MNLFKGKKKLKMKTETTTGVGMISPVSAPVVPKLKPACGFEYNGLIYKTAAEANRAYQLSVVMKELVRPTLHFGPDCNAWLRDLELFWFTIVEIAHMKLEVE